METDFDGNGKTGQRLGVHGLAVQEDVKVHRRF